MNILFPTPAGQNGYDPQVRSLNAKAESLDTVIRPGFVNSILSVGNTLNPDDMLLVSYANGTQLFSQTIANGVITLAPANETVPFPFTNVQFVAAGGSDLNIGNNLNAPKATISAALSAISAGGLVWVLDSQIVQNQQITFNQGVTLYAPNAFFVLDAVSGSVFTQVDTGGAYIVNVVAQTIESAGGASFVNQNGSFSTIILNAAEIIGIGNFNGTAVFNALLMNGVLNLLATSQSIFNVTDAVSLTLNTSVGARLTGKLGNTFYGPQFFINQIIFQQQEDQETVGRTLAAGDSNTTVNYMNTITGNYVFPNSGIPVGTRGTFTQLSSGVVEFDSDGTSTILSYLNASPVVTNGLNSVATWEQISQGVYMISGNITVGGGGG